MNRLAVPPVSDFGHRDAEPTGAGGPTKEGLVRFQSALILGAALDTQAIKRSKLGYLPNRRADS